MLKKSVDNQHLQIHRQIHRQQQNRLDLLGQINIYV
jgi:hypothetical protein